MWRSPDLAIGAHPRADADLRGRQIDLFHDARLHRRRHRAKPCGNFTPSTRHLLDGVQPTHWLISTQALNDVPPQVQGAIKMTPSPTSDDMLRIPRHTLPTDAVGYFVAVKIPEIPGAV